VQDHDGRSALPRPELPESIRPGSRVVIAALVPAKGDEAAPLIEAAAEAVETAGAAVAATLLQRRGVSRSRTPGGSQKLHLPMNAATFIGRGKVAELAELVRLTQAGVVLFCNPLTPTQQANLEQAVGVPVVPFGPAQNPAFSTSPSPIACAAWRCSLLTTSRSTASV